MSRGKWRSQEGKYDIEENRVGSKHMLEGAWEHITQHHAAQTRDWAK